MWKDEIKKANTNLKLNDDFRQKVEDALEDLIDDLARTPECIKNAKKEGDSLKQYIDPEFMALDAINEVSDKMIKNYIDMVSQNEAEARFDL
jgi:septal ring factor EnvC (AmiA/AmiB activator)